MMTKKRKEIRISNRIIGEGQPVFIVAEIGQNHNGQIDIAKQLIDAAVKYGADAVKFCKRDLDSELTSEAYNAPYIGQHSFGRTYGEHRAYLELSAEQHKELFDYCKQKKIIYFASVCGFESADLMEDLGVELFKIASRDLTNLPLVEYVAKKQKPIIMSTGMSDMEEIEEAVDMVKQYNDKLILLQTTSQYPVDCENVNLRIMKTLRDKFDVLVGYSGHTLGIVVPVIAAILGAVIVEKHLTLERVMRGSDHMSSLEPDGLRRVVRDIRNLQLVLGVAEKKLLEDEIPMRRKLARSLVSKVDIRANTIIREDMLILKSPGTGIKWSDRYLIVGKKARRDIEADRIILLEDVEPKE